MADDIKNPLPPGRQRPPEKPLRWERTNDFTQFTQCGRPLFDALQKWLHNDALCLIQRGHTYIFCHQDDVQEIEDHLAFGDWWEQAKETLPKGMMRGAHLTRDTAAELKAAMRAVPSFSTLGSFGREALAAAEAATVLPPKPVPPPWTPATKPIPTPEEVKAAQEAFFAAISDPNYKAPEPTPPGPDDVASPEEMPLLKALFKAYESFWGVANEQFKKAGGLGLSEVRRKAWTELMKTVIGLQNEIGCVRDIAESQYGPGDGCDNCPSALTCQWAFSAYNTDGDFLCHK